VASCSVRETDIVGGFGVWVEVLGFEVWAVVVGGWFVEG